MTASLLAFSLSDSFTKVGAVAAFVALLGIAVLSLLTLAAFIWLIRDRPSPPELLVAPDLSDAALAHRADAEIPAR